MSMKVLIGMEKPSLCEIPKLTHENSFPEKNTRQKKLLGMKSKLSRIERLKTKERKILDKHVRK